VLLRDEGISAIVKRDVEWRCPKEERAEALNRPRSLPVPIGDGCPQRWDMDVRSEVWI